MARHGINIFRAFGLAAIAGTFALLTGCAGYAHTTTVVRQSTPVQVEEADRQADEFIGTPIMGDYDNDENLDFVLEVRDSARVFKLDVHETAGGGNRELLENVRQRVNSLEDAGSIRVIGYYNPEYRGSSKEYGFLDLKMIAFYDEETGKEEAYFTDPQESPYYTESDVTVIYAPGHHYSHIYYPRYVSPWWDSDGDGIPNRYDPWPMSYDVWYDYNMNYIPDWYDPYYVGYYPYWSYWDMNFWVGYNWYSPGYYYRGYSSGVYYNDYCRYTRLYDRKFVNGRDNTGRRLERMDAKSESAWRRSYEQDSRRRTTRVADSSPGARDYRGYESRTPDNRVLSDPSLRTRVTTTSNTGSDRTIVTASDNGGETFTRNRVTSGNTTVDRSRDAARVTTTAGNGKTKTTTVSDRTRETSDRASVSSRSRDTGTSSSTNPVYRPTNGRTREMTSGRTTTSSSSGRVYRPSGSSSGTQPAATSSSSRSRSSSSSPASVSSSNRSRSSSGSSSPASVSNSSSRSRSSSQPAARSSSSSSRSSSSSARSSSSSSSSRSRSSSSGSSSSSSSSSSSRNRH